MVTPFYLDFIHFSCLSALHIFEHYSIKITVQYCSVKRPQLYHKVRVFSSKMIKFFVFGILAITVVVGQVIIK